MVTSLNIPLFNFYLVNAAGQSYHLDNGLVQLSGTPNPLDFAPDGWEDLSLGYERSPRYGVLRNFSITLGFVGDGARILKHLFYSGNIDQKVWLLVQKRSTTVGGGQYSHVYRKYYKGEIDFSTFKDEEIKVSVSVSEGGRVKDLKANEGTKFEFDADEVDVRMDGLDLECKLNFQTYIDESVDNNHILPIVFLNGEGTQLYLGHADQVFAESSISGGYQATSNAWFLKAYEETTIRIHGRVRVVFGAIGSTYQLHLRTNTNRTIQLINTTISSPAQNIDFDEEFTIEQNEAVFLEGLYIGEGGIQYGEADFSVDFTNKYQTTTIKGVRLETLYKRLVEKLSASQDYAISTLLASKPNIIVTCGDAIRGIAGSKIKTTFNDFFQCVNALFSAGLSVEDRNIVLERKSYFFDTTNIISLGRAKSLKVSPAVEYMANVIKAGYQSQNIEDVNGKLEFNNLYTYSTPVKILQKDFEIISSYRTGAYEIEIIRINLEGKTTTDDAGDNAVYLLNIEHTTPNVDGSYNLLRKDYDAIAGIPSPSTIFNIEEFTSKRMIAAHNAWLAGMFYKYDGETIRFESTDKNRELSTTLGGVTYDEDADIPANTLGAPLWLPDKLEIECEADDVIPETLRTNPKAAFSFEWNGVEYIGFLLKGAIASKEKTQQMFSLLSAPTNDLSQLINV